MRRKCTGEYIKGGVTEVHLREEKAAVWGCGRDLIYPNMDQLQQVIAHSALRDLVNA